MSITKVFEQQANTNKDNIAVVSNSSRLTYQQLNNKSNQIARYILTTFHLAREEFIGLYLDRSSLLVTSILSIFKAGGAYVPMGW